jgi:hypothetical protein
MKAYLITPETQSIDLIEILNETDIQTLIGYDTIISDAIGNDHHIFFDEECFLRQAKGRFQIDKLAPISGRAIVMSKTEDALSDTALDANDLESRIAFTAAA